MPLTAMIWSPMLTMLERAAAPVGHKLAMTTVGTIEPQPLSTITSPNGSPFCFGITTCTRHAGQRAHGNDGARRTDILLALLPGEELELVAEYFLRVEHLLVVDLAQVARILDAVRPQKLGVRHLERLPNGLGDEGRLERGLVIISLRRVKGVEMQ